MNHGYGARQIRRLVQNLIENKIASEYLNGNFKENTVITAFSENNNLYFK
jgi:ATP-dependent Clp protease ATP-binding subunit ClpA